MGLRYIFWILAVVVCGNFSLASSQAEYEEDWLISDEVNNSSGVINILPLSVTRDFVLVEWTLDPYENELWANFTIYYSKECNIYVESTCNITKNVTHSDESFLMEHCSSYDEDDYCMINVTMEGYFENQSTKSDVAQAVLWSNAIEGMETVVRAISPYSISVEWIHENAFPTATIYWMKANSSSLTGKANFEDGSFTVTDLEEGTIYKVWTTRFEQHNQNDSSRVKKALTMMETQYSVSLTNLVSKLPNSLTVRWAAEGPVRDREPWLQFKIYYKLKNDPSWTEENIVIEDDSVREYTINTLAPSTGYSVRVTGFIDENCEIKSEEKIVVTRTEPHDWKSPHHYEDLYKETFTTLKEVADSLKHLYGMVSSATNSATTFNRGIDDVELNCEKESKIDVCIEVLLTVNRIQETSVKITDGYIGDQTLNELVEEREDLEREMLYDLDSLFTERFASRVKFVQELVDDAIDTTDETLENLQNNEVNSVVLVSLVGAWVGMSGVAVIGVVIYYGSLKGKKGYENIVEDQLEQMSEKKREDISGSANAAFIPDMNVAPPNSRISHSSEDIPTDIGLRRTEL